MQRNPSVWVCFFVFFLPKASFKMGTFSDPQHTHPGIFILEFGGGGANRQDSGHMGQKMSNSTNG